MPLRDRAASHSASAAMTAVASASVEGAKAAEESKEQLSGAGSLLSPKASGRTSAVPISRASTAASPSNARSQADTNRAHSAGSASSATARSSRGKKDAAAASKKKKRARIVEDAAMVRRLVEHARAGQVEALRHICSMEGEPRLDFEAGAGEALVAAAEAGHTDAISALLEFGANVNCLSGRPLQRACLAEQLPAAQLLLSHAADPSAPAALTGFTPVMLCCMADSQYRQPRQPAESASKSAPPSSLSLGLPLSAAAPPSAPSSLVADSATTASATARSIGSSILAQLHSPTHTGPLSATAAAAAPTPSQPAAATVPTASPPSQLAVAAAVSASPRLALLRLLLSYPSCCSSLSASCSSHYCGPYNGWQALHFAADRGDVSLVSALLQCGAEVDGRTAQQDTSLAIAAERGHAAVVQSLVAAGASLAVRRRGLTAVEWSVYRGQAALVEWLVAHGARAQLDVRVSWLKGSLLEVLQGELSEALLDKLHLSLFRGEKRQRQRQQLRDELLVFHWHSDSGTDPSKPAAGKASVKCFLPAAAIDSIVAYQY